MLESNVYQTVFISYQIDDNYFCRLIAIDVFYTIYNFLPLESVVDNPSSPCQSIHMYI